MLAMAAAPAMTMASTALSPSADTLQSRKVTSYSGNETVSANSYKQIPLHGLPKGTYILKGNVGSSIGTGAWTINVLGIANQPELKEYASNEDVNYKFTVGDNESPAVFLVHNSESAKTTFAFTVELADESWNNDDVNDWKTAMNNFLNSTANYQSPEYQQNVELHRLKAAAAHLGDAVPSTGDIIDNNGTVITNAMWDSYAVYHLFDLGHIENLKKRLENLEKLINKAESEYQAKRVDSVLTKQIVNLDSLKALQAQLAESEVSVHYVDATDIDNNVYSADASISVAEMAKKELLDSINAVEKGVNEYSLEVKNLGEDHVDVSAIQEKIDSLQKEFTAVSNYVKKLQGFEDFLKTATDAKKDLTYLENLINAAQDSIDKNHNAVIDQYWIDQFTHSSNRLRQKKLSFDKFLDAGKAVWANNEQPTWTPPANITVVTPANTVDIRGTEVIFPKVSLTWKYLKGLMGGWSNNNIFLADAAEDIAPINYGKRTDIGINSIRGNAAYFKWLMQDYKAKYDSVVGKYNEAVEDYNLMIAKVEVTFKKAETVGEVQNTWYDELLNIAKDSLNKEIKNQLDSVLKHAQKAKATGDFIDYSTENSKFTDDLTGMTNAEKWLTAIKNLMNDENGLLKVRAEEWMKMATDARAAYDLENRLVSGDAETQANDFDVLKNLLDYIDYAHMPEKFQKDYKTQWDSIVADTAVLKNKIDLVNKTLVEVDHDDRKLADMAINNAPWTENWTDQTYQADATASRDYSSYANLKARLDALKAIADVYKKELAAYNDLMAIAANLETRLQNASDSINALTKGVDYLYRGSDFYGFKGTGDLASQNTGFAKVITDFIGAFRDSIEANYKNEKAQDFFGYKIGSMTTVPLVKKEGNALGFASSDDDSDITTVVENGTTYLSVVKQLPAAEANSAAISLKLPQNAQYQVSFDLNMASGDALLFDVKSEDQSLLRSGSNVPLLGKGTYTFTFNTPNNADDSVSVEFAFKNTAQFFLSNMRIDSIAAAGGQTFATKNIKVGEEESNSFADVARMVLQLERDGFSDADNVNAYAAVKSFAEECKRWIADSSKVENIYKRVKDHAIYTDHEGSNQLRYDLRIKQWRDTLQLFKDTCYVPATARSAENQANEHWKVLSSLKYLSATKDGLDFVNLKLQTPTGELNFQTVGYDDVSADEDGIQIMKDKDQYAKDALTHAVYNLNDQLRGVDATKFDLTGNGTTDDDGDVRVDGKIAQVITDKYGWKHLHDSLMTEDNWKEDQTDLKDTYEEYWKHLRDSVIALEKASKINGDAFDGRQAIMEDFQLDDPTTYMTPQLASDALGLLSSKIQILKAQDNEVQGVKLTYKNNIWELFKMTKAAIDSINDDRNLRDSLVGKTSVYEEIGVEGSWTVGPDSTIGQWIDTIKYTITQLSEGGKYYTLPDQKRTDYQAKLGNLQGEFSAVATWVQKQWLAHTLRKNWATEKAPTFETLKAKTTIFIEAIDFDFRTMQTADTLQAAINLITSADNKRKYGTEEGRSVFEKNLKSFGKLTYEETAWSLASIDSINKRLEPIFTDLDNYDRSKYNVDSQAINTMLNKLGHSLTVATPTDQDVHDLSVFASINDVPNNMIAAQLLAAELNKLAYDGIIAAKTALFDRAQQLIEILEDENQYEQIDTVVNLKNRIKNDYLPIPAQLSLSIENCYAKGRAVAENKDEETNRGTLKAILTDSLNHLNELWIEFSLDTQGYNQSILEDNNKYKDSLLAHYNSVMAAYNKAVKMLDEFDKPTEAQLLEMYQIASKKFHDAVVYVPGNLYNAKEHGLALKAECDAAMTTDENDKIVTAATRYASNGYETDNDIIKNQQTAVDEAISIFLSDIKKAMLYKWTGGIFNGVDYGWNTDVNCDAVNSGEDGYEAQINEAWEQVKYFSSAWSQETKQLVPVTAMFDNSDNLISTNPDTKVGFFAQLWKDISLIKSYMDLQGQDEKAAYGEFLLFDKKLVELQNAETGLIATLNKRMNSAANSDLMARLKAKTYKIALEDSGLDAYTAKISENGLIDNVDNAGVIDTLKGRFYGVGMEALPIGENNKYYTYEHAVNFNNQNGSSNTTWAQYVEMYDSLLKATVKRASALRQQYFEAGQLPNVIANEGGTRTTRDTVLYLMNQYGKADVTPELDGKAVKQYSAIKKLLNEEYTKFTNQSAFLAAYEEFKNQFKKDSAGISSLIVGPSAADYLEDLSEELAGIITTDSLNKFKTKFNGLTNKVKSYEYTWMKEELSKMYAEYNTQTALNDPDGMTQNEGESNEDFEARKEKGAKLVTFYQSNFAAGDFDNGATISTEPGNMNIKHNTDSLDAYENGRKQEENGIKATWEQYLQIENNVARMKALIYQPDDAVREAELAEMYSEVKNAYDALLGLESRFIIGQNLLAPENPAFEDDDKFLTEDFGLLKYYKSADYKEIQSALAPMNLQLTALGKNIETHKEDMLLYKDTYLESIDRYKSEILLSDTLWNANEAGVALFAENGGDLTTSAWMDNQKEIEKIRKQKEIKDDLLAQIKIYQGKIEGVREAIESMGFKDDTHKEFNGQLDKYQDWVEYTIERLNMVYLANRLSANSSYNYITKNDGPFVAATYYAYKDNEAMASRELYPMEYIMVQVNGLLTEKVDQKADALYTAAKEAYDNAKKFLENASIKKATRAELLKKFDDPVTYDEETGNIVTGEFTAVLNSLKGQKTDRVFDEANEKHIGKYQEAVEQFIKMLGYDPATLEELENNEGSFLADVEGERLGDVDNNNDVDVVDLTSLLKLVIEPDNILELTPEEKEAYDLNSDGLINIVDLGIMQDLVSGKTAKDLKLARQMRNHGEMLTAEVFSTDGNRKRIAISLNNWRQYAGFQMDVMLPEGMTLVGQQLSERATTQTLYANEWANGTKNRIVAYTMGGDAFNGETGNVLYIDVETSDNFRGGKIQYSDITFLTTDGMGVNFQMQDTETTGIMDRIANAADAAKQTIYNVGGRVMNSLKKGVNIIRGNNGNTEKVIKK